MDYSRILLSIMALFPAFQLGKHTVLLHMFEKIDFNETYMNNDHHKLLYTKIIYDRTANAHMKHTT